MASFSTNNRGELFRNVLENTTDSLKWKLNLPKKPNYDNVYLFKETKKFFKAPCYDLDTDKLPDSYKGEQYRVKTALQHTKSRLKYASDSANKKRLDMARQWKELEAKEEELKSNFIEFNSFLISNANKRRRAEQNYNKKRTQIKERTEAIEFMNKNIAKMKNIAEAMRKRCDRFSKYENFLQLVVNHSDFKDIMSIIKRYTLLEETKIYDVNKIRSISEVFYEEQVTYTAKTNDYQVLYLQFSTELSGMRQRYDNANRKTHAWERVMETICNRYSKISQEINWVGTAVRHLFEVVHYRLDKGQEKKIFMEKLGHINSSMKALETIQDKLNKIRMQRDADTSMAQVGDLGFDLTEGTDVQEKTDYDDSTPEFGQPVSQPELNPDNMEGMWVKQVAKRPVRPQSPKYTEKEETERMLERTVRIKLPRSKFHVAKVKDFVRRYRKALIAIERDKMDNVVDGFKTAELSKEPSLQLPVTARILKPKKTRWAVAVQGKRMVEGDVVSTTETDLVPLPSTPVASTDVLTLIEDEDDEGDRLGTRWIYRKPSMKKAIEKRFDRMAGALRKELGDRENAKTQQILPPIYQSSQVQLKGKRVETAKKERNGV